MRKSPTVSSLDEDDLLPLSTFSSSTFSVQNLAKKRLLLSQGEMMKLISDYERAVKIELVSLVNDNYQDFIKLSDDVQAIASRACELKFRGKNDSNDYSRFKLALTNYVSHAKNCRSELEVLANEKEDMLVLSRILDLMVNFEFIDDCFEESNIPVLVSEFKRLAVMVDVLGSSLSEQIRSSPILTETMTSILDEKIVIKSKLIAKLLAFFSASSSDVVLSALWSLGASAEIEILFLEKSALGASLSVENLPEILRSVESNFFNNPLFSPGQPWEACLKQLVLKQTVAAMDTRVFVPNDLEVFRRNFLAFEDFFSKFKTEESLKIFSKWQLGMYISQRVRWHMVDGVLDFENLARDLPNFEFPGWPPATAKLAEAVVAAIDQSRRALFETSQLAQLHQRLVEMEKKTIEFSKIFSDPQMAKIFVLSASLFKISSDEVLSSMTHTVATAMLAALESVKQLPALYRVASRPMPTRHSVYIDLCCKHLTWDKEDLARNLIGKSLAKTVGTKYKAFCQKVQEQSDPRITAQLKLDWAKLDSVFQDVFGVTLD